jgi:hypothetical protein
MKLSLDTKHGAFNMMLKEKTKLAMKTSNIPTTQESSHVKITNEYNAHHIL